MEKPCTIDSIFHGGFHWMHVSHGVLSMGSHGWVGYPTTEFFRGMHVSDEVPNDITWVALWGTITPRATSIPWGTPRGVNLPWDS